MKQLRFSLIARSFLYRVLEFTLLVPVPGASPAGQGIIEKSSYYQTKLVSLGGAHICVSTRCLGVLLFEGSQHEGSCSFTKSPPPSYFPCAFPLPTPFKTGTVSQKQSTLVEEQSSLFAKRSVCLPLVF